jgi:phage tail protein X
VAQSTPVDKLIQKFYANSPLSASVLRKALVDANPKVITGNPQQRVKAGTVIVVPDHGEVVKHVLTPHVEAKQVILDQNPAASDNQSRKHWVRFP